MSHHIPEAVTWCLLVALIAVAVLLIRQRRITTAVRARVAALEENVQARDEEVARLVAVRLPSVADSMHKSAPLPGLQDERLAGTAFAQSLQSVMELFAQAVDRAQERVDQSAKAALKASMRALQGLAHEQQLAISRMQERHDNPDVLQDLLEIDHANSQFGRRAQAIAVLCGSWPGRQRVSSQLTDVVRGATSRIRDYRRVRVHGHGEVAVVSRAVEPVVLAVAELLDNAARHSQPNTTVEVSLQPVHNGACVVIDDAGVGMDGQELQRAAALLSGRRPVDVSRLGDPPQFGFPVIGVLAARYGFSVSVDTSSPYGGVRAVLFLPSALLINPDLDGPNTTPLAPPSSRSGAATAHADRAPGAASTPPVPGRTGATGDPGRAAAQGAADAGYGHGAGESAHAAASGAMDAGYGPGAAHPSSDPASAGSGYGPGAGDPRRAPGADAGHARGAGHPDLSPGDAAQAAAADAGYVPGSAQRDRAPVAGHPAHAPGATHPAHAPGAAHPAHAPGATHPDSAPAAGSGPSQGPAGTTAGGLPKRRRRQPARQAPRPQPAQPLPPEATPQRTAEETARRMGAFARGTRAGRTPAYGTPTSDAPNPAAPNAIGRAARPGDPAPGMGSEPELPGGGPYPSRAGDTEFHPPRHAPREDEGNTRS
ncbi:ATP-binding protein [Streptomyces orinoci]|uniref:ATP-binding protein n=1 Tax=Streptomyces orinoci TaxID=67339 RepID=UPI003BAA0A68